MNSFIKICAILLALAPGLNLNAADNVVRVGVLKFGTVNWELSALKDNELDSKHGIDLEIVPYASGDATDIALQGGEVDIIVSDWLWVSRQRAAGADFTMSPYSSSVGAIMVPGDSPANSLADLKGMKIGVAGGPLDKSWLLLQGLAKQAHDLDLPGENEIVFGAPPLLAEKAKDGELDAVLNFWHYCARLEAEGFRELVSAEEASSALGAQGALSSIGYVFGEKWAKETGLADKFLAASRETKMLLESSDEEWQKLSGAKVIKDGPEALLRLRDRYRAGIPRRNLQDEIADTQVIYKVLVELGGKKLVGDAPELVPGTFWSAGF